MDCSRVDANPPHPNIKVEAVAHEAVVNYRELSQPIPGIQRRLCSEINSPEVKNADSKNERIIGERYRKFL
ncbi:MAG: hypothetical protein WA915_08855 [Candidatus Aminicenantaceae bacterium]